MDMEVFVFFHFRLYPAHVTYPMQGLWFWRKCTVSLMPIAWQDIPRPLFPLRRLQINRTTRWCACLWQMSPQEPRRRPFKDPYHPKHLRHWCLLSLDLPRAFIFFNLMYWFIYCWTAFCSLQEIAVVTYWNTYILT